MPTMTITCPHCGISGTVDSAYANRKVNCRCGGSFIVHADDPEPLHTPQPPASVAESTVAAPATSAGGVPIDLVSADDIDRHILQLKTESAEEALAALPGYGMRAMARLFAYHDGSRVYQWPEGYDPDTGAANLARAFTAVGTACLGDLLAMLPAADATQARNIIYTLGRIDDPRVVEPLLAALTSPDAKTRLYAVSGVGERRVKRAIGILITLLADPDERVQYITVGTLGELGDRETLRLLQERMEETDNPQEMRNIQEVMGWLSM